MTTMIFIAYIDVVKIWLNLIAKMRFLKYLYDMCCVFCMQWDTRSGEIVQEYDRHLGAVNTITFIDQNRRFVSTSDDKSLRVWEW